MFSTWLHLSIFNFRRLYYWCLGSYQHNSFSLDNLTDVSPLPKGGKWVTIAISTSKTNRQRFYKATTHGNVKPDVIWKRKTLMGRSVMGAWYCAPFRISVPTFLSSSTLWYQARLHDINYVCYHYYILGNEYTAIIYHIFPQHWRIYIWKYVSPGKPGHFCA